LNSIRLHGLNADLDDFRFVRKAVKRLTAQTGEWWKVAPDESIASGVELAMQPDTPDIPANVPDLPKSQLELFLEHWGFQTTIAIMIILNAVYVAIDELVRNVDNEYSAWWLVFEAFFTLVFLLEFVLKFAAYKFNFFKDPWNRFDFVLVLLGIIGFLLSCQVTAEKGGKGDSAKLMRLTRVFRILRFLRVIRLFHSHLSRDEGVSMEVAESMHRIYTLTLFVHAHLQSEIELVKYFGGNNRIDEQDECEIGRCVLQSQIAVYKALGMAVKEEQSLERKMVEELQFVRQRKLVVENLEHFITSAFEDGAISAREAESILHPMHHHLMECMSEMATFTGDGGNAKPSNIADNIMKKAGLKKKENDERGDQYAVSREVSKDTTKEHSTPGVVDTDSATPAAVPVNEDAR
jgi:hypothetical protein